jgi:cytochrome oxidase assembly protein ShyY1
MAGSVLVSLGVWQLQQSSRLAGQMPGETTITGLIRGADARNFFTPDDNPAAGLCYTSDPDLIAKQLGLLPTAPFRRRRLAYTRRMAKRRNDRSRLAKINGPVP